MTSGPRLEMPVLGDAAVKKAGIAALLALVLSLPFIGIRLDDTNGPNGLAFRPQYVAAIVIFVFLARLVFLKTDGLAAWRPNFPPRS